MNKKAIVKIQESSSLIRSLDDLVNSSINGDCVFHALTVFYEKSEADMGLRNLVNYVLDTYNDGFTKHESLLAGYFYMSSGLEAAERFKYNNFGNPYIDGEYLDEVWDDD